MRNYSVATLERIGDITRGIHVKTGTIANTVALPSGSYNLFTVYGRVRLLGLDCEAVTAFAADATLLKWQFECTTPVVAAADISAASLSIASIPIGARVMWRGTAVATAPDVSATQASIAVVTDYMDVGTTNGVGIISAVSSIAAQTSGSCRFNVFYLPISDGAYIVALV